MFEDKKYICIESFEIVGSFIRQYDIYNITKLSNGKYKVFDFITPICLIDNETFDTCFREATNREKVLAYELKQEFQNIRDIAFRQLK